MATSRADGFVLGFTSLCAALLLSVCRDAGESRRNAPSSDKNPPGFHVDMLRHTTLSSDIRSAVTRRCSELDKLFQSPDIVEFLKRPAPAASALSDQEIQALDAQWKSAAADDEVVSKISDNDCSKLLAAFLRDNRAFAEIFVTDTRGLNICQTNKTSDYYQADEGWWKEGYSGGAGRRGFGSIEFDKSAGMEAIPLHLPIYDPETRQVIGVAKGVLNLTRILAEL